MTAEELGQFRELCAAIIAEKDQARYPELMVQFTAMVDKGELEQVPMIYSYYVVHMGGDFKVVYMDGESARRWEDAGWEALCYDTNETAQWELAQRKDGVSPGRILEMVKRR